MGRHNHNFDLIVIGSGAGGGTGATLAASWGKKVALFEKEAIGGECPNWACVPTKALLHSAEVYETVKNADFYGIETGTPKVHWRTVKNWKDIVVSRTGAAQGESIFTDDGITVVRHEANFISKNAVVANGEIYKAKRFLVATGTTDIIPPVPGLRESGYITFRQAIDLPKPPKSLFIIGGGPIGCEFAQLFSTFGTQVYIADMTPRLLAKEEVETGALVGALFAQRGVKVLTNCIVQSVEAVGGKKTVHYEIDGEKYSQNVEEILVAAGKRPFTGIGLDKAGVKFDEKGNVITNRFLITSNARIAMAGDVVGPYQFTHTASYQSHLATYNLFKRKKIRPDYSSLPRVVFTAPEVASVGITEHEARSKGIDILKGSSVISVLGRANTSNQTDGFVKVITTKAGVIIGASIVAPRAGEMIHELALAIKLKATAADVASTIHAFPTYSEAVKSACSQLSA